MPKVHDALEDCALLDRVAIHKSIYFVSAWANYSDAQKGSLRLVPPPFIFESLERDYSLMKNMFFGSIPEWSSILKVINGFEMEFNQKN